MPGTNKALCLKNFINCFPNENIAIIADNCGEETLEMLRSFRTEKIIVSHTSNAGSLSLAIFHALGQPEDEIIYFVEDDYLHREGMPLMQIIKEGLDHAEYVTLYDHPDKYQKKYDYGEVGVVRRTNATHWRATISTCMTFATRVKYLRDDLKLWHKYTLDTHPHDHKVFCELKEKGRNLLVSIPGLAFHTDLTYIMQHNLDAMVDNWVIDYMELKLDGHNVPKKDSITAFRRLFLLEAYQKKKPPIN